MLDAMTVRGLAERTEVDPGFGTGVEVGHCLKKRVTNDGIKKA